MSRYYFDITDAGETTRDAFGIELADDDEARDQVIALLPELARDRLPDGDAHAFVATARNESGEVVYEASLILQGTWRSG